MISDLIHIRIAAILAVVVAFGGHAVSQSALGHIRGTITDAQLEGQRGTSHPHRNPTGTRPGPDSRRPVRHREREGCRGAQGYAYPESRSGTESAGRAA